MRFRILDLETTGVEPTDRVVELGYTDLFTDTGLVLKPHSFLICPFVPIPPELSAIHHITDEDVASAPGWDEAAPVIFKMLDMPDLGEIDAYVAHNAKFERQWITDALTGGKDWVCTYRCALRVWPDAPSHSNQALRYWLKPEGLDRTVACEAHRAAPDAYVTAFTLRELLKHASFDQLVAWSAEPALHKKCTFGKHRGVLWTDVPRDYVEWMLRQADMDEDQVFSALEPIRAQGRAAAGGGTEELRRWFAAMSQPLKQAVKPYLDDALKPIAAQADELSGVEA